MEAWDCRPWHHIDGQLDAFCDPHGNKGIHVWDHYGRHHSYFAIYPFAWQEANQG
jgi:hypothetical protein